MAKGVERERGFERGFEVGELSFYWNVDEGEFREKVKNLREEKEKGKCILVAGFPPMGNIVPYHLKEILEDSEKVLSLYSCDFPPMVEAREDEFEIPHDEIWFSEQKRLFCYVGKYPETDIPRASYKQAECVARLTKELGVKELYTVGVIVPMQEPFKFKDEEARVEACVGFFEGSKKGKGKEKGKEKEIPAGVKKMTRGIIGRYSIIRKTGLLPGFASKLGIESYAILGVGKYPEDLRACAGALRAFKKLSGLESELETTKVEEMLEEGAKAVEERIKKQREQVAYRGEGVEVGTGAEPSQSMYV